MAVREIEMLFRITLGCIFLFYFSILPPFCVEFPQYQAAEPVKVILNLL